MPFNEYENIPVESRDFLPDFIAESEENLRVLNEKFLEIENAFKEGKPILAENLNAIFRAAHSIKGTGSFIGVDRIVKLTHKLETILQKLRDGELPLSDTVCDVIFHSFDTLNGLLSSLKAQKSDNIEIAPDLDKMEQILAFLDAEKAPIKNVAEVKKIVRSSSRNDALISIRQVINSFNELLVAAELEEDKKSVWGDLAELSGSIFALAEILQEEKLSRLARRVEQVVGHIVAAGAYDKEQEVRTLLFAAVHGLDQMVFCLGGGQPITEDILDVDGKVENYMTRVLGVAFKMPVKKKDVSAEVLSDDQLVDLSTLTHDQRERLQEALGNGYDAFKLICQIDADIPEKILKVALMEERLKKVGGIISMRPEESVIEKTDGALRIGLIYCSVNNETDIRKALSIYGVQVEAIDRVDESGLNEPPPDSEKGERQLSKEEIASKLSRLVGAEGGGDAGSQPEKPAVPEPAKGTAGTGLDMSIIKIDSRKIDKLMVLSGELVTIRAQFARLGSLLKTEMKQREEVEYLLQDLTSAFESVGKEFGQLTLAKNDDGQRTSERLRRLMAEISRLLGTMKSRIVEKETLDNINVLEDTTNTLEKISSEIQGGVMQTRMVPIEIVFNRFKRIVRDIAKEIGKNINLKIEGEDTELDKKIVDSLNEPLTHMVRNAIDHGIEDKETRKAQGKPEEGLVLLRASHSGNSICLEIGDDGRGMDPSIIAAAAVKKGLIKKSRLEHMTDKEKLALIFLPGFSTAAKVTDLSGRGVGMDSVRTMISSLNGIIDIKSAPGEGTTFLIKIPLTLAIIQALLVRIGEFIYAFPVETVTEIIKVAAENIYSIDSNPIVKLREHALSLISLEQNMKIVGRDRSRDANMNVVIVTDGANRLGIMVDELICKEEIVIKSLSQHFVNVKGIAGASILADGRVALILDTQTIIHQAK